MAKKDDTAMNWALAMSSVAAGVLLAGIVMAMYDQSQQKAGKAEYFGPNSAPLLSSINPFTSTTPTTDQTAASGGLNI